MSTTFSRSSEEVFESTALRRMSWASELVRPAMAAAAWLVASVTLLVALATVSPALSESEQPATATSAAPAIMAAARDFRSFIATPDDVNG